MASKAVRDAVVAKIAADFAALPFVDTRNKPPKVESLPQQWFTVEFRELEEEQISFGDPGNNCWSETGFIVFQIADHVGKGEDWMLTTAETLRNGFRDQILIPGLYLGAAGPPATGEDTDEGPHKFTTFAVDYDYEYRR